MRAVSVVSATWWQALTVHISIFPTQRWRHMVAEHILRRRHHMVAEHDLPHGP
jgi:hypothetical protein